MAAFQLYLRTRDTILAINNIVIRYAYHTWITVEPIPIQGSGFQCVHTAVDTYISKS